MFRLWCVVVSCVRNVLAAAGGMLPDWSLLSLFHDSGRKLKARISGFNPKELLFSVT